METPGELKSQSMVQQARQMARGKTNVFPYTLIGIGAAWWLANRWTDRAHAGRTPDSSGRTMSDRTAALRQQATRTSREARSRWDALLQENPLVLGMAAMAAGALVGASFRSTELENAYLGPARETARQVAIGAVSKLGEP